MGTARKRKRVGLSLSASRPPTARGASGSVSRRATRSLINQHHSLEKERAAALKRGNKEKAAAILTQISSLGGLERYQQASLVGQSKGRGGDSSKVLLEWLRPCIQSAAAIDTEDGVTRAVPVRMLEVGALTPSNACSSNPHFQVERIDLHSRDKNILQQDFMKRPVPSEEGEKFDVVSLSLVLNFVPEATARGDMLRHTTAFLRHGRLELPTGIETSLSPTPFPSVFIVVPRSCVTNSRYLTEQRFTDMMSSLGFAKVQWKLSGKLAYSLWRRDKAALKMKACTFPKKEVNPGHSRNNFAIVLGKA